MNARACPRCRVSMQGLRWDGIELERCTRCGGVWFDQGELERLSARTTRPLRIQPSPTCCVDCEGPLMEVRMGLVRGASCIPCGGTFVEGPSMREVLDAKRAPTKPPHEAQVRCRRCLGYVSSTLAIASREGFACRRCAPTAVAPDHATDTADRGSVMEAGDALEVVSTVLEIIGALVD